MQGLQMGGKAWSATDASPGAIENVKKVCIPCKKVI